MEVPGGPARSVRDATGEPGVVTHPTTEEDAGDGQGDDEFNDPYFSVAERERLRHWREVCAQRPALTREQIETVGALLRTLDQRRAGKISTRSKAT